MHKKRPTTEVVSFGETVVSSYIESYNESLLSMSKLTTSIRPQKK